VNKVATRHDSGALSIWQVDANWNFVAQDAFVGGNSAAAFALETSFQTDLNSDGVIGSITTIENNGGVALVKNAVGQVFAKVGAAEADDITFGGSQVNEISGPWRVMAAEAIGGVNKVATRHDSGALSIWQVDANWNFVAQDAFVGGTSAAAFALETSFQTDLNGDGIVGSPSAMPEDLKLLGAGEVLIGGIGDWNI
jgi:serralysin